MTAKVRFFPPAHTSSPFEIGTSSPNAVITIDPTAAAFYDALPIHEQRFIAHGWTRVADVGATADRPTANLFGGQRFYDTSIPAFVTWDGAAWREVDGTAA